MAFEFHHRRLVYWQDTDLAGIIHFTNYFRYMEEAEMQFYRSLGIDVLRIRKELGVFWPRVAASCDFLRPVTYGDELDVHLWVRKKGRCSIGYEFSFRNGGQEVARGRLTVVCAKTAADGELKSAPIPSELDAVLDVAPFAAETE